MEKQIEKMMKKLDLTREEAIQLIEDDKRIDKGEKLFSLSKEQEKASKEARSTGTKQPTAYKFNKRERKVLYRQCGSGHRPPPLLRALRQREHRPL